MLYKNIFYNGHAYLNIITYFQTFFKYYTKINRIE